MLANEKRSSLLCYCVSDEEEKGFVRLTDGNRITAYVLTAINFEHWDVGGAFSRNWSRSTEKILIPRFVCSKKSFLGPFKFLHMEPMLWNFLLTLQQTKTVPTLFCPSLMFRGTAIWGITLMVASCLLSDIGHRCLHGQHLAQTL